MSVLQPISYGLVHQVGPGTGARGFGSYKADNTETIRPYQQEASSPIGRGYPMGIVSGAPTVYDPRAGIKEDPVVVLLKKILGMKTVVDKAPDAGFMSNKQVYVGGDYGMGGGGGGNVVVGNTLGQAPAKRVYDDSTVVPSSSNSFKSAIGTSERVYDDSTVAPSSSNSFKSAIGKSSSLNVDTSIDYSGMGLSEVYEQRWDDWIDVVGDALDEGSFYGLEKSAIVGSEGADSRLEALEQLDDILLELRILDLDSDRGMVRRYRNSDVYYAGLAELTGEISFDEAYGKLLTATDEDRITLRREILDYLKKTGVDVLSKSTIEANVLKRTNNQGSMTSSGSSFSGDIDIARGGSSRRSSLLSRRSSMFSNSSTKGPIRMPGDWPAPIAPGVWISPNQNLAKFLSIRGQGVDGTTNKETRKKPYSNERPKRLAAKLPPMPKAYPSSSSSGNSSGVSFNPKKPDTSKAFNRTSKKKKNFTKKK